MWQCPGTHRLNVGMQEEKADALSRENLVLNELFREYLSFNGYGETLSVLLPGKAHLTTPASFSHTSHTFASIIRLASNLTLKLCWDFMQCTEDVLLHASFALMRLAESLLRWQLWSATP